MDTKTMLWRSGKDLGAAVREARDRMGLTQARLARLARVGLKFLYELESGKDTLRADKVLDVLKALELQLVVMPSAPGAAQARARYAVAEPASRQPDYIGMACTTAGVSLRKSLSPDELIRALLTGKAAPDKYAHFIVLLEEAPSELLQGLVAQVGTWSTPAVVARNLRRIAAAVGVRIKSMEWPKTA
jgi:HTH-type transcriptional regulator/antitoxin HipB